ncbi:MAG TPA: hypothetical protein VFV66_07730 [Nonomuraea sp.]|nr:hypothetical protein [Nonomuraea sp.]
MPVPRRLLRLQPHHRARIASSSTALVSPAFLLLAAGHQTTANMISYAVIRLLAHLEQRALITAYPARTPRAVEEPPAKTDAAVNGLHELPVTW